MKPKLHTIAPNVIIQNLTDAKFSGHGNFYGIAWRTRDFSFDNEADDVFVLQNGFYRFNGKWKQRGLGKLGTREIEHLDTFEKERKTTS